MLDFTVGLFGLVAQFVSTFSEYFLWYMAFTAITVVAFIVYRRLLRW